MQSLGVSVDGRYLRESLKGFREKIDWAFQTSVSLSIQFVTSLQTYQLTMQRYETPEKQIMRGDPECPPAPRRQKPPALDIQAMRNDPEYPSPPRRPLIEADRATARWTLFEDSE